ncbi:MAG: hypothetical protein V3V22_03790 [Methylococcales bacterium]
MKLPQSKYTTLTTLILSLTCQCLILSAPTVNAGILGANNYWECILDDMQGVKNDRAAKAVTQSCYAKFSNTSEPVDVSAPLFGAQTRDECFASYGKEATSFSALKQLRMACHFLYPEAADQSAGKYLDPILQLAD